MLLLDHGFVLLSCFCSILQISQAQMKQFCFHCHFSFKTYFEHTELSVYKSSHFILNWSFTFQTRGCRSFPSSISSKPRSCFHMTLAMCGTKDSLILKQIFRTKGIVKKNVCLGCSKRKQTLQFLSPAKTMLSQTVLLFCW